jgi:hypothetical protein
LKTDIPSLTPYALKTDIPSLTPYALKTELKWVDNTNYLSFGNVRIYSDKVAIASTVINNSVVRKYPPAELTNNSVMLNNSSYGNGVYTSSASGGQAYYCFNYVIFDNGWQSPSNYNNQYGYYTGYNRLYSNGANGEWIKIILPINLYLSYIKIRRPSLDVLKYQTPKRYILLGSVNNLSWVTLLNFASCDLVNNPEHTSATLSPSSGFNYFAIIITDIAGNSPNYGAFNNIPCVIGEIELYGYEKVTEIVERVL